MKEVRQIAAEYAVAQTNEVMSLAIAKAYADGYRDGYRDRDEEVSIDIRDNKTEYVDLGLPSGTLWASDYEKSDGKYVYLPYEKSKRMSLPTKDQWQELIASCKMVCDWVIDRRVKYYRVTFIATNGNSITFLNTGYIQVNKENIADVLFWLHNEGNDSEKEAVSTNIREQKEQPELIRCFAGFKLPIRLVR